MATSGRKPIPPAPAIPGTLDMAVVAEDVAAADQLIELRAEYSEERDLANQLLGQAQMADSISKFTQTVSISKLSFVREHKLYKALKGKKTGHGDRVLDASPTGTIEISGHGDRFLKGTWEEYCDLLGRSREQVDRDIANLQAFGEEALESMSAMGIGYRELRQYRKLPEDQKLALIEVAKAGDKDSFVELAEEIIAKHAKEKEAHAASMQEAADKLESKDRLIAQKNELIDQQAEEISRRFIPRPGCLAQTEEEQKLITEIQEATVKAQFDMRRVFEAADAALCTNATEAIELAARQAVEYLCQQLVDISTQFNIAVDLENRLKPSWMSEEMLTAMEAQIAASAPNAKPATATKTKLKSVQGTWEFPGSGSGAN